MHCRFMSLALTGLMIWGCRGNSETPQSSESSDGGQSEGTQSDGGPPLPDPEPEDSEARCNDGIDNDQDGRLDCNDLDCAGFTSLCEDAWHNKANRGEVHDPGVYVSSTPSDGAFALSANGVSVPLVVDRADFEGVKLAVTNLSQDIGNVTTLAPEVVATMPTGGTAVVVGTIGKSPLVDGLIAAGKLDVSGIEGKWETFVITSVANPFDGVESALVVVGSDQRGTIFGVYDLSAQIGVSPWHFWADVPPKTKAALYVLAGAHTQGEPAVKYRGIFINDENPALQRWHETYFPGEGYVFRKALYARVYELMLRLKANYLWPAVWGRAFAEDDPENHAEATRYGIVMGTSHEAPMMRGIEEWNRDVQNDASGNPMADSYGGNGEWSYRTNQAAVESYWRDGIHRMVSEGFEGIITIGMRGPGDVALPAADGIPLVNDFIAAQRTMIEEEFGTPPTEIPQVWTLYKEVLDWWEEGLRAPADVTVIWADDNWGNMRRLPDPAEPARKGGYGLYYHFDYVGGPRNYKWVDTNLVPNIWEQLHLSYDRGVDRIWMVNVGDLKGNELPTQFFMDYAWNPERWPVERLEEWERSFAAQQFGDEYGETIAAVMRRYSLLQSDRKPELTNENTRGEGSPFSLTNYQEMERVTAEWQQLATDASSLGETVPAEYQDTYFQLVLYPVRASALMYELRLANFKSTLYAQQGRASANDEAAIAQDRFAQSRALADQYNTAISGGKWNGYQTQPYLGYSTWQQPEANYSAVEDFVYPDVVTVDVPAAAGMGVAVDGSTSYWPDSATPLQLPGFSPYQSQPTQYIEVFNQGSGSFDYEIVVEPAVAWLTVSSVAGTIDGVNKQVRAVLSVNDWTAVPEGTTNLTLRVSDTTNQVSTDLVTIVEKPPVPPEAGLFVEANGYIAMEAGHFSRAIDAGPFTWTLIPQLGRTGDAMTPFPVTTPRVEPTADSARLEYDFHLFTTGDVTVYVYLSPRLNVLPQDDLMMALSMDDGDLSMINVASATGARPENTQWQNGVADNVHRVTAVFSMASAGTHTVKLWASDPTVVVQKLVVDTGGMLDSYFGPPESYRTTP